MNWRVFLAKIQRVAYAALLVALPVTSFPFFPPAIGGEALVRPLAMYPLLLLVFLTALPGLFRRSIPKTIQTLLPFVLVAIASSLLSLLRGIEPALGISVQARILRGMTTLFIGCAFYLVIALWPQTVQDLRFALRWLYTGSTLAFAWGSIQAVHIARPNPALFAFLEKAQTYISIRPLREDRIAGLTYEPHWFAEQIIVLILPWSLAAVLTGYSAFRWRWRWLTLEWIIAGWAVLLLPFTFSRSGLLSLVILVFLSLVFFRRRSQTRTGTDISEKNTLQRFWSSIISRRFLEILLGVTIVLTPIYLIGARNAFFARLWAYWETPGANFEGYLSHLGFDARVIYGQAALRTYQSYPLLGVGLGNYAFYFEEMLPYRSISEIPEVLFMITPERGRDRLITAKNFYLRLLAETGIIGAVAFLAFAIAHLGCAFYLWLSDQKDWQYWGTASLCGMLAFALSAFTFDSFVIPNTWVVFGLITAATKVMIHTTQSLSVSEGPPAWESDERSTGRSSLDT